MSVCNILLMDTFIPLTHGIADYPIGTAFGPRNNGSYELVWLLSGSAIYHHVGGDQPVQVGDIVLCHDGERDGFTWDKHRPTKHAYIHFHAQSLTPLPYHRPSSPTSILTPLAEHCFWLLDHGQHRDQWAMAMQLLLTAFTRDHTSCSQHVRSWGHPLVDAALQWIGDLWREEPLRTPTTTEWAAHLGISRVHLSRIIKETFLVPPAQMITLLKLDRGMNLLTRTQLTIQEIAFRCGFESPFHFSRTFKKTYGQSPKFLRAAIAEGAQRPTLSLVQVRQAAAQLGRAKTGRD